jgi:hypothetical protein
LHSFDPFLDQLDLIFEYSFLLARFSLNYRLVSVLEILHSLDCFIFLNLRLCIKLLEFSLQLRVQFPNNLSFILRREGYVAGVVQNTDVVGFEVSGLEMHKNEGQNGVRLHSELLVEIVEYSLDWQDNIHWLSIEKVVQILFS